MVYREGSLGPRLVVSAFGEYVVANDVTTGARVWTARTFLTAVREVEIDAGRVYVLGASLVCLDHATGRQLWRLELPSGFHTPTLLVAEENVLVADAGQTACIDGATGSLRWHDVFSGMSIASVALAIARRAETSRR